MDRSICIILMIALAGAQASAEGLLEPSCSTLLTGDLANILMVTDVDGDGVPNILMGTKIGGNLHNYVYKDADCTQDWTHMNGGWTYDTPGDVRSFAVSDLDGDGRNQVIINSITSSHTQNTPKEYVYVIHANGLEDWDFNKECGLSASVDAADVDGTGIDNVILGTKSKKVCALADDTKSKKPVLWSYVAADPVEFVKGADMTGDAVPEIIAYSGGYRKGDLTLLSPLGQKLWTAKISGGMYNAMIPSNVIKVATLSSVGPPSIVIGTYESGVQAYSNAGKLIWEYKTGNLISAMEVADIDGDSDDEVIIGSAPNVIILDGQGKKVASWNSGSEKTIYSISAYDMDSDGKKEIAVGTHKFIYVLDDDGSKYGEWKYTVEIQGLTKAYEERDADAVSVFMGDLDGDGEAEIASAWNWQQDTHRGNQYSLALRAFEIDESYREAPPTTTTVMAEPEPDVDKPTMTEPTTTVVTPQRDDTIEDEPQEEEEEEEEEGGMCCIPMLPAIIAAALAVLLRLPLAIRRD